MFDLTGSPEWLALTKHYEEIGDVHLRQFFAQDADRATSMTTGAADLVLDYSKHRITTETLTLLIALARAAGVEARRDAMFAAPTSTPPRTGRCCTWRCACPQARN